MKKDKVQICLVVDRSGSMISNLEQYQAGLTKFIIEQKQLPGECLLTFMEFDDVADYVIRNKHIKDTPDYRLVPRNSTALYDALGKAINDVGKDLADLPESERPERVLFVILTDGEENSSGEYTKEKIKKMIQHQESVYSWEFIYLGADQDAFAVGGGVGMKCSYNYAKDKASDVIGLVSSKFSSYRSGTVRSMALTPEEQKDIV